MQDHELPDVPNDFTKLPGYCNTTNGLTCPHRLYYGGAKQIKT